MKRVAISIGLGILGVATLLGGIWHFGRSVSKNLVVTENFPDTDVCSLACGASWQTYATPGFTYSRAGFFPRPGDAIEWKITHIDNGVLIRFAGLWYLAEGNEPLALRVFVNRIEIGLLSPHDTDTSSIPKRTMFNVWSKRTHMLLVGDVIRVEFVEVGKTTGYISIQPGGGH